MGEVFIQLINMPPKIGGFAKKNSDDTHTIVINSKLSSEMQKRTLLHELQHIEGNDFESEEDAIEIEKSRKKRL